VVSGLEVVVVCAERVEFVDSGVSSFCPRFSVVVFDANPPAALHGADGGLPGQRDLLRHGRTAAEVGDVEHIHTAGDHQFQDGPAQ
jgi:hypothetical protein